MPRSRAGMRRSCSKPLRLPRRVAKRVKTLAKAGGGGDLRIDASVSQTAQSASQSKDLLDIGTKPCHHGEWSSERGVALASQERLFPLQEGLKVLLRDLIDQSFDPATVLDPLANRFMEGLGNVGANLLLTRTGVEIESRMPLPALAAAVRLTARSVSQYQIAPKKGLVGQELNGAGACRLVPGPSVEFVKS